MGWLNRAYAPLLGWAIPRGKVIVVGGAAVGYRW